MKHISAYLILIALVMCTKNSMAKVFDTKGNLPLSKFYDINSGITKLEGFVNKEVINHWRGKVAIAYKGNGENTITYFGSSSLIIEKGSDLTFKIETIDEVEVNNGSYCIVALGNINELPVVTHWKLDTLVNIGCASNVKGSFKLGATDGLYRKNTINTYYDYVRLEDDMNENEGALYWDADRVNLFSSTEQYAPHKRHPQYEEYIAEAYSMMGVSVKEALLLSDEMQRMYGYPVMYKNAGMNFSVEFERSLPAFQIISGIIIEEVKGKSSLATIILPPYWEEGDEKPVFLNQYYDHNDNVFYRNGKRILRVMGQTLVDNNHNYSKNAIGVVWNGGGSRGTFGLNESADINLISLLTSVRDNLNADIKNIITFGASRGGVAAFNAVRNPYNNINNTEKIYDIKYLLAYSTCPKIGDVIWDYNNASHPSIPWLNDYVTGFKFMWKKDAGNNSIGFDSRLAMADVIGGVVTKFNESDTSLTPKERMNDLSAISDITVENLQEMGTKILLSNGTHDGFFSSAGYLEFYHKLRNRGVDLRYETIYRGGHSATYTKNIERYLTMVLDMAIKKDTTAFDKYYGYYHYTENGSLITDTIHHPVYFEGPMLAVENEEIAITLVGPEGAEVRLRAQKLNDDLWRSEEGEIKDDGSAIINVINPITFPVLSKSAQPNPRVGSWIFKKLKVPKLPIGYYKYILEYRLYGEDNFRSATLVPNIPKDSEDQNGIPEKMGVKTNNSEGNHPVFRVVADGDLPHINGYYYGKTYGGGGMTWGLSEK